MLIRDLLEAYRSKSGHRSRREDYRHAAWWTACMGREPVSVLTTAFILQHLDRLGAYGRSPSTVAFYLRFLRRVTAWGALMGYLPTDPCAGMALPKENPPPLRVLTEEEEAKLCLALGPPYALWVKLAIETGMKQSEQFTLRWRDVDLHRATLLLPHRSTGAIVALSLSPVAVTILQQLRQIQTPSMWVFPDPANPFRAVNIHAFYVGRWVRRCTVPTLPGVPGKIFAIRLASGSRSQASPPKMSRDFFMRQRETRQAYTYRAWREGRPRTPKRLARVSDPIFVAAHHAGELGTVLSRDLTQYPISFAEAARLYVVYHLQERPARRDFESLYRQFWHAWRERPLQSLSRKEIQAWYRELAHIPGRANKGVTFLRSLYNWALSLELVPAINPAQGIRRFPSYPRERCLTTEEVQRMMQGLLHLPEKPRAYLLVLLFTAARRSEARLMQWTDLDEAARLWKKPRTKNGTSQLVPLPVQVMDALQRLPRTSRWVFSSKGYDQPWSAANTEKLWGVIRRRWGLDDVRLHDLRRTVASDLSINGENLSTVQHVLNHRSLAPTSIYARLNTKAIARALQAMANRFSALQSGITIEEAVAPSQREPQLIEADPAKVSNEEEKELIAVGEEWLG